MSKRINGSTDGRSVISVMINRKDLLHEYFLLFLNSSNKRTQTRCQIKSILSIMNIEYVANIYQL